MALAAIPTVGNATRFADLSPVITDNMSKCVTYICYHKKK